MFVAAYIATANTAPAANEWRVRRRISSLLQLDNFERFEHPHRAGAGFILRANQSERTLVPEQRLSVPFVGHQNLVVSEFRIDFAQREHHLVSVMRLRDHVSGQRLASELSDRRAGSLEDFAQRNAFI